MDSGWYLTCKPLNTNEIQTIDNLIISDLNVFYKLLLFYKVTNALMVCRRRPDTRGRAQLRNRRNHRFVRRRENQSKSSIRQ
jgi:hypothetical protein